MIDHMPALPTSDSASDRARRVQEVRLSRMDGAVMAMTVGPAPIV
jgi:hypothetical protein